MSDTLTPEEEAAFDALPEGLRLELLARVRRIESRVQHREIQLTAPEFSEAAAIPLGTTHRRYRIALMKLRNAGQSLESPNV